MSFNIDEVKWSRPRIVNTKQGPRRIREWMIPDQSAFWNLWHNTDLKQQGYSVSKWKGEWMVTEWRTLDGLETDDAKLATAAVRQSGRVQNRIERLEPDLPEDMQRNFDEVADIYEKIKADTGNDYSYQLPSIKRLCVSLEAFDSALDASDTGTGKTFVACAVARVLELALLVVCPKNVLPPWKRAAELFDVEIEVINYEMLRTGKTEFGYYQETPKGKQVFKYSPEVDPEQTLFVFDECHRMKDWRTLNCGLGLAALDAGFKVLALSATAADNPMHMKFVSLLTGLIQHPSHFWGWMLQNGVQPGKYGHEFIGGHNVLSRIHRQIFPLRGSRIRVSELGDIFPQTTVISEAYEMEETAKIQKIYRQMHEELRKLQESKSKDKGANILTAMLRARQEVELLKVPTLVQMVNDGLEEGMSVVVILNFDASIKALTYRLKTSNTITGADKPEIRQQLIDGFNADEERLIVMNIKAGGLGISLHGNSRSRPRLVLISPTFSGIDLKQALGRCHRAGGARSIQKIVWAANTIEEKACNKVRARLQRVSIFNDDQLDDSLEI
jgi:superfamily II DNA or RNA helicase